MKDSLIWEENEMFTILFFLKKKKTFSRYEEGINPVYYFILSFLFLLKGTLFQVGDLTEKKSKKTFCNYFEIETGRYMLREEPTIRLRGRWLAKVVGLRKYRWRDLVCLRFLLLLWLLKMVRLFLSSTSESLQRFF